MSATFDLDASKLHNVLPTLQIDLMYIQAPYDVWQTSLKAQNSKVQLFELGITF